MEYLHLVLLALVQGITEFLPISSSGHLVLLPRLAGWEDQGLAYDVAAHFGSLVAVVVYFRADLARLAGAWAGSLSGGGLTTEARLAWAVLVGTIPVGLVGLAFRDSVAEFLRDPLVIAAATVGFGVLLGAADLLGRRRRDVESITLGTGLLIGIAQALAIIPGTSRSGITMTAGLALGLTRSAAARFSFLLSVPVIFLASGVEAVELLQAGTDASWGGIATVALLSALTAFACIHIFLGVLERIGMMPFVVYRLLLGGVLFWLYF